MNSSATASSSSSSAPSPLPVSALPTSSSADCSTPADSAPEAVTKKKPGRKGKPTSHLPPEKEAKILSQRAVNAEKARVTYAKKKGKGPAIEAEEAPKVPKKRKKTAEAPAAAPPPKKIAREKAAPSVHFKPTVADASAAQPVSPAASESDMNVNNLRRFSTPGLEPVPSPTPVRELTWGAEGGDMDMDDDVPMTRTPVKAAALQPAPQTAPQAALQAAPQPAPQAALQAAPQAVLFPTEET
ncbi:hypothetical protein HKX48_002888, partial [Thoreauomyces humboldtii]